MLVCALLTAATAMLGFMACGGGDDAASGDDSGAGDSGADGTTGGDGGQRTDGGRLDSGPAPFCDTTPCVVSLAAGGTHTCAIISDGTVRCWGGNLFGALGSGMDTDSGVVAPPRSATPIAATGESDVVKVAAGGYYFNDLGFTCALHADKTLDCWGFDEFGQLGNGSTNVVGNPSPQPSLATDVVDVSASYFGLCAVMGSGDISCWGENSFGQVSPPVSGAIHASPTALNAGGTKFVQVSAGYENACAVTVDGHLWCWGEANTGASGSYTDGGVQDQLPAQVAGIDSVASVSAGDRSACALKTDGSILCFGTIGSGILGRADADVPGIDPTPKPIDVPAGTKFTQIAGHETAYCALDTTSQVWCWGYSQNGETGVGVLDGGNVFPITLYVPTKVDGLTNVDQISVGAQAYHACALIHGGSVKCWGSDSYDELGFEPSDAGPSFSITPVDVQF